MNLARKDLVPQIDGEAEPSIGPRVVQEAPRLFEDDWTEGGTAATRLTLPRITVDAFVTEPASRAVIEDVARDRRAVRSEIVCHAGGFDAACAHYRHAPPADLVIIEDDGTAEDLEARIGSLAEFCPESTQLLIIGSRNDIALYRRLIKIGVSDYLIHPVAPLTLLDSVASIFSVEETRDVGQAIAVLGARGGVGASTVAHNTAAILRQTTDAVTLLIDADIGFGTAALQFDIAPAVGLADALNERDDLVPALLEKVATWRDRRFGILAAPDRPEQMTPPQPGAMRHLIDQARRMARHVVLDLPHGWSPSTAEAVAAADTVLIVATPDLPSLRNARMMLGMIAKLRPNDPPPRLVLNRLPLRGKPPVTAETFARVLGQPIAAALPFAEAAGTAEMAGRVLAENAPDSEIVAGIRSIVDGIAGKPRPDAAPARRSLLSRLVAKVRR